MTSRLYSFLDEENNINAHFFEGRTVLQELTCIQNLPNHGQNYFRHCLLGLLPTICFLKYGESMGLYLDSQDPYYRFKVEFNGHGNMRALLIPEDFNQFPSQFTGPVRLVKTFTQGKAPYSSIVDLKDAEFGQVIHTILEKSYQVESISYIPLHLDSPVQSILLHKIPVRVLKVKPVDLNHYWIERKEKFDKLSDSCFEGLEDITKAMKELGLVYLGPRDVQIQCLCSHERMLASLKSMGQEDKESLFTSGQDLLEGKCDYCKKVYQIKKSELLGD